MLGCAGLIDDGLYLTEFAVEGSSEAFDLGRVDQLLTIAELSIQDWDLNTGRIGDVLDAHSALTPGIDGRNRGLEQAICWRVLVDRANTSGPNRTVLVFLSR